MYWICCSLCHTNLYSVPLLLDAGYMHRVNGVAFFIFTAHQHTQSDSHTYGLTWSSVNRKHFFDNTVISIARSCLCSVTQFKVKNQKENKIYTEKETHNGKYKQNALHSFCFVFVVRRSLRDF